MRVYGPEWYNEILYVIVENIASAFTISAWNV